MDVNVYEKLLAVSENNSEKKVKEAKQIGYVYDVGGILSVIFRRIRLFVNSFFLVQWTETNHTD